MQIEIAKQKNIVICINNIVSNGCNKFNNISNQDLYLINTALKLKNHNYRTIVINVDLQLITPCFNSEEVLKHALFHEIDKAISVKPKIFNYKEQKNNIMHNKHILIGECISECIKKINNCELILFGCNNVKGISKTSIYVSNRLNTSQSCSIINISDILTNHIKVEKQCQNNNKIINLSKPSTITLISPNKVVNSILHSKTIMKFNKIPLSTKDNVLNIDDNSIIDIFTPDISDKIKKLYDINRQSIFTKEIRTKNIAVKKITHQYDEADFIKILYNNE